MLKDESPQKIGYGKSTWYQWNSFKLGCPSDMAATMTMMVEEQVESASPEFRLNGKGRSWKYAPGTSCQDRSNVSINQSVSGMVLWIPSCMSEVGRDS